MDHECHDAMILPIINEPGRDRGSHRCAHTEQSQPLAKTWADCVEFREDFGIQQLLGRQEMLT